MNKRKLQLDRTTLRQLQSDELANVAGGDTTTIVIAHTRACPERPTLPFDPTRVQTIGTSGTSVINPSGGIVQH